MNKPKKGKWIYSRPYDDNDEVRATCGCCGFSLEGDDLPRRVETEVQEFFDGFGTLKQRRTRVIYEPPCQCPYCEAELIERK